MGEETGILFGHQMTNWNSQQWTHPKDDGKYSDSDVFTAVGDWPVIFGYNFLEMLDGESFTDHAKWAFENGGVVNFYWEAKNPTNNADAYNCNNNPIEAILPNGDEHDTWLGWLDEIAEFAKGLQVGGKHVPIIFRLFHEMSGFWYWWGTKCATDDQFKHAWNMTVSYLRDTKHVHNILYAYAPAKPSEYYDIAFGGRWPGDEWVDIISWDRYDKNTTYRQTIKNDCKVVVPFAQEHKKVVALGETGVAGGVQDTTDPEWFYEQMFKPLATDEYCGSLSYLLTYVNYKETEYWVPIQGQATYPGFVDAYTSKNSIFLGDDRWQQTGYYQGANATCCHAVDVKNSASNKAHYRPLDGKNNP